jgi:hypothetical protein
MRAPADAATTDDLPADFDPGVIGPLPAVLAELRDRLPGVGLSDPTWGALEGETWAIELNIGRDDPVTSIMLHVRGDGDGAIPAIMEIAGILGCRALDMASDTFLSEGDTDAAGWRAFQEYRDRVLGRSSG